jgi:ketosteroid isomerase-like protein
VTARELPPIAVAVGFVDCINRGDIPGLTELMTEDHQLVVFDEAPVSGKDANVAGWQGYVDSFPEYVIYPSRIAEQGGRVAVLGSTTGSHLGLPDDEERELTLIWLAEVAGGRVRTWRLIEDTAENRKDVGL